MASFSVLVGPDFAIFPSRGYVPSKADMVPLQDIVDGYLAEEHTLRLSKTHYPVEDTGLPLTDHAIIEPRSLKLEGWVSDLLSPAGLGDATPAASRGVAAWQQIKTLMETREPIRVITTLDIYGSMLITSVKAPVDRTTGRALRFEMELEEVLLRNLAHGVGAPIRRTGPAEDRPPENDRGRLHVQSVLQPDSFALGDLGEGPNIPVIPTVPFVLGLLLKLRLNF